MSVSKIRRAVIPAAGFGTRFLPFTKSVPKELVPVVDKPVIQYVVEEAVASGIEEILIILSEGKEAIRRHFSPEPELEARLEQSGKTAALDELRAINRLADIRYVYQHELNGLGGAVLLAKKFAGNEFFAVLLGDTILTPAGNNPPVLRQLLALHERYGAAVVAAEPVAPELVSRYGILGGQVLDDAALDVKIMVEKPAVSEAPSRLAVASRYVLSPAIFAELERTPRGKGNEIQLTDAMRSLLKRERLIGCRIAGTRHDIGDKMSFLRNTVAFGLRRPEFKEELVIYLKTLLKQEEKKEE